MNRVPDRRPDNDLAAIEARLLLEGIYQVYGLDFRDYSVSTITRKATEYSHTIGLPTISALQERVLHDPRALERFLWELFVTTTSLFRDPQFYADVRTNVLRWLRTYPFIRIWHAGCSTGEEVYSMAILLHEENLYSRARIYATDIQEEVLTAAKQGRFPAERIPEYSNNYLDAGGKSSFSDYFIVKGEEAIFDRALTQNVTFQLHNLATDHSFQEFNYILCRNVLIYFNKELRNRVHNLLFESLCPLGILSLGENESLYFTSHEMDYRNLNCGYQKTRD
ncbi:protein-glutamate O-methyltransferase CheR [bacterium]|nr:protein-glutamate O-methyltransferase CheR [bacterium]